MVFRKLPVADSCRRLKFFYCLLGVVVFGVSMLLMPSWDDWFFLRYFDNVEQWGIPPYKWLDGNHWLIRDYWRPLEDQLLFWEAGHAHLFPYLNHGLIVATCFAAGYVAYLLGVRAGVGRRAMLCVLIPGILATNNMGAIFSIDSWTHVMASFWGLMSVWFYSSKLRGRYLLWIVCGAIACMSKESGFVFFVCGPLYALVVTVAADKAECGLAGSSASFFRALLSKTWMLRFVAAIALAVLYLGFYFAMKQAEPVGLCDSPTLVELGNMGQTAGGSLAQTVVESQGGHHLTPLIFIKNLFILYGAGIYPVATSAVYYNEYWLLGISALLALAGPLLLLRLYRGTSRRSRTLFWGMALLAVVTSLPSVVTRAGEISPFNSNMFLLIAVGSLVSGYSFKKVDKALAIVFVAATLISDVHKFSIGYEGGMAGVEMGRKTVELSPESPENVLWVGVYELKRDRAGAAFSRSPYRGYYNGSAALREYGYRYPKRLEKIVVPDIPAGPSMVDSIVRANAGKYDCIWVSSGEDVRVYR